MLKKRIFSVALALAIAASAATVAPRTTLALNTSDASTSGGAASRANGADKSKTSQADATDGDAQGQTKRKGNGFARALGAPFRAIARLFGGGKKSTTEEAKKRKASTPQTTAAVAAPAVSPAPTAPAASETPKPSAKPAASVAQTQPKQQAAPRPAALKVDKSKVKTAPRKVDVGGAAAVASVTETEAPPPTPSEAKPPAPSVVATRPDERARVVRPDETGAIVEPPRMWIPVIEGISKDPLTQGRALLEHGYVQEAVAELTIAATQIGPTLGEANNLLGIAYDRLGQHKQAAEAYNRALTVAPKDPTVIANLGYSLYLSNDYAGSLKRLKQAAKLAPGQPVIYNNLGVVTAAVGKYEEAYKYFVIASNDYDAHLRLAAILEDHKRDREAIKHYEAALAMQPNASAVLERLVALYERTGERDKADTARKALGQPKNPQKTTTGGGGG